MRVVGDSTLRGPSYNVGDCGADELDDSDDDDEGKVEDDEDDDKNEDGRDA